MRLNETRETLVNKKTPIYLNNKMLSFVIYAGYESHDFAEKEINPVLFFFYNERYLRNPHESSNKVFYFLNRSFDQQLSKLVEKGQKLTKLLLGTSVR